VAGLLDALSQTWPAKMGKGLIDAVQLPGQVAGGLLQTQPQQPGMWSDVDEARQQATQGTMMDRAADLGGMVMGGSYAAAPAVKNATGMGIRAYHGSPHDFDRFDLSKIGTGEGAQAYGHGLYFAEKEGTAKAYRDALSGVPSEFSALNFGGRSSQKLARAALDAALASGLKGDEALDAAMKSLSHQGNMASASHVRQPYYDAVNALGPLKGKPWDVNPGRMYEVDINARPEQFLDWDKPLKAQPVQQNVLSAVRPEMRGRVAEEIDDGLLGHGAFAYLNTLKPVGDRTRSVLEPATQSKRLLDAGIPGIKYLDQGSRGAGEGSRNYVVFDDKLVNILRKYGLIGGAATGAMYQGSEAQAAP
jgi:hypothetical protein